MLFLLHWLLVFCPVLLLAIVSCFLTCFDYRSIVDILRVTKVMLPVMYCHSNHFVLLSVEFVGYH